MARRYVVGLYYYRLRHYDPEAGRFVSRDPLGMWGDPGQRGNAQNYCGNNPVNRVDPLGLKEIGNARQLLPGVIKQLDAMGLPTGWLKDLLKKAPDLEFHTTSKGPEFVDWPRPADDVVKLPTKFYTKDKKGNPALLTLPEVSCSPKGLTG